MVGRMKNIMLQGKRIMSEEDTFNALRRTPFLQMCKMEVSNTYSEFRSLLKANGWSAKGYLTECHFKFHSTDDKEEFFEHWKGCIYDE